MTAWPRAILHVDMDAFFVNVHILDHPEDKNIPLVVGGKPSQRGVVSSASYEARKKGIHSAMSTKIALRIIPQLKIVSSNWTRIRECSREVMNILSDFGPLEQMSVDEAYIDLTDHALPEKVAEEIKTTVKLKTELPCSVGLATNKLVAKVASDRDKPEGLTIVLPGHEARFLEPLSTRVILGIGPRTAEELEKLDISTCGQLAKADRARLSGKFGSQASSMILRAQGIDNRPVQVERGPAKSISQEWTFNNDIRDQAVLRDKLEQLSTGVARSLQKKGLIAHTINIKIRWRNFKTITRQITVSVGIDQEKEIFDLAHKLWQENWEDGQYIRLLGVGVSNIEKPAGRQLGFKFDD